MHPNRVLTPVAPSVSVPKGQVSHAPLELAILYKFARQLMQVPLSKVLPGEQTHCESEVAPLTPFVSVPEGQFVHVPARRSEDHVQKSYREEKLRK